MCKLASMPEQVHSPFRALFERRGGQKNLGQKDEIPRRTHFFAPDLFAFFVLMFEIPYSGFGILRMLEGGLAEAAGCRLYFGSREGVLFLYASICRSNAARSFSDASQVALVCHSCAASKSPTSAQAAASVPR